MEFRVTSDFKVKQVSFKFKPPFAKHSHNFSWQIYKDPSSWASGIGSLCRDGMHVLFFDYDSKTLQEAAWDQQRLQENRELSHAYFFQLDRPNSYHVIVLDKFSATQAYHILNESNTDWGHKESVKKVQGHEWLLRSSPKGERGRPKWVGTLHSTHLSREISTAHKRFIEINYDVPKEFYLKEDGCLDLPVIQYNTGNRVEKEVPENFMKG